MAPNAHQKPTCSGVEVQGCVAGAAGVLAAAGAGVLTGAGARVLTGAGAGVQAEIVAIQQHIVVLLATAGPEGQKAGAEGMGTPVKDTGGRAPLQITRDSRTQPGGTALAVVQVRSDVVDAAQARVVTEACPGAARTERGRLAEAGVGTAARPINMVVHVGVVVRQGAALRDRPSSAVPIGFVMTVKTGHLQLVRETVAIVAMVARPPLERGHGRWRERGAIGLQKMKKPR